MSYFLTKVWGWHEPIGPLVFGDPGWRENARAKLRPGDLVVLVGTKDQPTLPEEQGRLLGIMQPTTEPVMSLDFPREYRQRDYDDEGKFKWPYGLLNARAWTLLDRPLLTSIAKRDFNMDAVRGIVPLADDEAALVAKINTREAELARPTAQAQDRIARATGQRQFAAPPPSTTRRGVMHMRRANALTYLFRLAGANRASFKVGWAFDVKLRRRGFNHAAMPGLGGIEYQPVLTKRWHTAREAFRMEQTLLRTFQSYRHPDNQEVLAGISESELKEAWYQLVQE